MKQNHTASSSRGGFLLAARLGANDLHAFASICRRRAWSCIYKSLRRNRKKATAGELSGRKGVQVVAVRRKTPPSIRGRFS